MPKRVLLTKEGKVEVEQVKKQLSTRFPTKSLVSKAGGGGGGVGYFSFCPPAPIPDFFSA